LLRQRLITATSPISGVTQFQYDAAGNTTVITQADVATLTVSSYDRDGNVFQAQQPNGDVVVSSHDAD
jgi:YD repeat-containing protein